MTDAGEHRKIRFAVVGAGNIAQMAVLPAFAHASGTSELVALISGDAEKRAKLCARHGIARAGSYEEYERILGSGDIDAVYIALPNTLHREYTERAARAGVHVLCEKPMAMTEDDCEAMIRAAEAGGVRLMIAYRLHFEEATLRAVEMARQGVVGEPRFFSSVFSQSVRPGDIRTRGEVGGGALYDLGVYCVNAARCLFGSEPEEVSGFLLRGGLGAHPGSPGPSADERVEQGVDESAAALLRFPGGRIAELVCSQAAAGVSSYRLIGTSGDLRVEPAYDYADDLVHHLTLNGNTTQRLFPRRDQFAPELIHFSQCILRGTEPEPSGEEGLADVRVLEAVVRSAETGAPVRLPPFQRRWRPDMCLEMRIPPVPKHEPVRAPSPTQPSPGDGAQPTSWGGEGGAGAYPGAPVVSGPPSSRAPPTPRNDK